MKLVGLGTELEFGTVVAMRKDGEVCRKGSHEIVLPLEVVEKLFG